MAALRSCLPEILDIIIEHLLVSIGIQKAVLLRTVSKAFDTAILHAICTRQVVDVNDPATPCILQGMNERLKGKILHRKSRDVSGSGSGYLQAIAQVNRALDTFLDHSDSGGARARHEAVAGAVIVPTNDPITEDVELQNVLSCSAIIGDLPALRFVLLRGSARNASEIVNGTTPYFLTPLTLAAARGHIEIVEFLLDRGARPDTEAKFWRWDRGFAEYKDWKTPHEGDRFRYLQECRPSALRAAIAGGHSDVVQLLLRSEHRISTDSPEYLRAILVATRAGHWHFVELLFNLIGKQLSESLNFGKFMMWEAIRGDQAEILETILDHGVDVNSPLSAAGQSRRVALHLAASLGRTRIMKILLDRGAKPNFGPIALEFISHPIDGATQSGQKDAMELLLSSGADPARAFYAAAWGGQSWLMEDLLVQFPQLNHALVLHNCFTRALNSCNLAAMTILVNAGLPLNDSYEADGIHRRAPIDLAMRRYGLSWVVEHLIALGAHPSDTDEASKRAKSWYDCEARGIYITERTWDWVGKY